MKDRRVDLWEGWYWWNGVIFDNAGNRYTQSDVRRSWEATILLNDKRGYENNIRIMNTELRNRLRMSKMIPELCLIWKSPRGTIEKTYKLEES